MAKNEGWQVKEYSAGWGVYASMIAAAESAIAEKQFVLGEDFSMADVVLGGTLRYMMDFKQIEPNPVFSAYIERLNARPAYQRAESRNQKMRQELGLK